MYGKRTGLSLVVAGVLAGAPLMIAAVTSIASLMAANVAVGVLGLVGAAMLWRWIPRYVPHRRR